MIIPVLILIVIVLCIIGKKISTTKQSASVTTLNKSVYTENSNNLSISEFEFEQLTYEKIFELDQSAIDDINSRKSALLNECIYLEKSLNAANCELLQALEDFMQKLKRLHRLRCKQNNIQKDDIYATIVMILEHYISVEQPLNYFACPIKYHDKTIYPSQLLHEYITANSFEKDLKSTMETMAYLTTQMTDLISKQNDVKSNISSLEAFCIENSSLIKILTK